MRQDELASKAVAPANLSPRTAIAESATRSWAERLPAVNVPPGLMVCHPSRFTNIYVPTLETLLLDAEALPAQEAAIRIEHDKTVSLPQYRNVGRRGKARTFLERASRGRQLDLSERLVYDARWIDNANIAHLFQYHLAALGLAKRRLGVSGVQCLVLLENKSPRFTHGLFNLLGYETCETNLPVQANLLRFGRNVDVPYHLLPFVGELEPPGLDASLAKKIFISRRGTRRLINESNVIALMAEHGYQTVYFEDISLIEQWSITRHATSIAAIHGAALGYLATKSAPQAPGFKLLELFSPGLVVDCFRKYTAVFGGSWIGCRGKLTPQFVRCVEEGPDHKAMEGAHFELDTRTIERALSHLGE